MAFSRVVFGFVMAALCSSVFAGTPVVDAPLPPLSISERGELTLAGDDVKFVPWASDANLGKVQVFQYFGATMSDSKIYEPFTDLLQETFEEGIHVTTILNLDAAMWGTTGFVLSELEKNKRLHPDATMVIDDDGTGVTDWGLGDAGTGLIITDTSGTVKYFTPKAMTDDEMKAAITLLRDSLAN